MSYLYRTEILKRREVSGATLGMDKVVEKQRSRSWLQFQTTFLILIRRSLQFDEFKKYEQQK